MDDYVIKKSSDRSDAATLRSLLRMARSGLLRQEGYKQSKRLQAQAAEWELKITLLSDEIARYDRMKGSAHGLIEDTASSIIDRIARLLIETRIAKQITQEELSKRCGVRRELISRYERTRYQNVKLSILKRIANALDFF